MYKIYVLLHALIAIVSLQYKSTYEQWKIQNSGEALDSTKLTVLGNILCGMSTGDVAKVNNAEYQ